MSFVVHKHFKLHIFLFSLLSVHLFVILPVSFVNKFLAVALCIGILLNLKDLVFEFKRWFDLVLFIIVNACLTMAFFGFDLFVIGYHGRGILDMLTLLLGFVWSAYVLQSTLKIFSSAKEFLVRFSSPFAGYYWRKWGVLAVMSFAVFVLWLIAYNPGILAQDSLEYIDGYFNGVYISFRSPVYAFLITLICTLAPTKPEILWVAVVQSMAFSALLATVLMHFHQKGLRFKYIIMTAIILPLIPSLALHTLTIWCDLACAMAILWFCYVLVRILDEVIITKTAGSKQKISFCIQLCLSLVFVYFMRANSFLVYIIMIPILAILFIRGKQWKLLAAVFASIILVLLIRFPGYCALDVRTYYTYLDNIDNGQFKYFAAFHDIQTVYYNDGNLSAQTINSLRKYIPQIDDPEVKDIFLPDWVENPTYKLHDLEMGEFLSMYWDAFSRNPLMITKAILHRTRTQWVIDPKEEAHYVNYTWTYDKSYLPYIGVSRQENILTKIMNKYIGGMNLVIPATFVWRCGIWTILAMISALYLAYTRNYIWMLTYIPMFVYLFTLFLTQGWTDYRYGLPIFLSTLYLPLMLLLLCHNTKRDKNGII